MPTTDRPLVTVERAAAVLRTLAESPGDLGNNEIARRVGINASTTSRLLGTLGRDELVHRVPETGRYRLGPGLVELGNAALSRVEMRGLAHAHLVALVEATGETATLAVPGEQTIITVDFVQSPSSVRSVAQLGRPAVPHATAAGKVFLAHGGRLPDADLPAYTGRTITDRAELVAEVDRTRVRGWALSVGEREDDLNAIAAPVLDHADSLVAVLGLQGPSWRFRPRSMREAATTLLRHAQRLSAGAAP